MGFLTTIYALLFYAAIVIFIGGLAYKIYQYASVPAPLKIPTMPAPLTPGGVALRLAGEVGLFVSLFRSNKWIWLFAVVFHASLWVVLLRHVRYFMDPVWTVIVLVQPFGKYAGLIMLVGLGGLLVRRLIVERIHYLTGQSDYFMLALLLIIGLSGVSMTFVTHTDIVQLKAFAHGLIYFSWENLPASIPLLVHLLSVIILMIVFPFSKLLHAPGVFFSPGRNQVDNAREQRHIAPWAMQLYPPRS
ncbi:MAG: nitrate reductase [Beggiatoa sp. IS2]|nr:MAG: nitrate reductase [Beggiatoa sp. IS2]